MEHCKYCKKEISNEGDFCGNCGSIKLYEEESISKKLIKRGKYIFTNPVAFIRTSTYADPIFTVFTAVMIILLEFIIIKGMGRKLGIEIPVGDAILGTLLMIGVLAFCMFGIVKWIFKKNVIFINFLNLTLSAQLILAIINMIGAILGVAIDSELFTFFVVFGNIISLLLMYQGIKDLVQADVTLYLATIVGGLSGTTLLIFIILKLLIKNALKLRY